MPSPVAKLKQHVANKKEERRLKHARKQPYVRSSADHNEFADWDTGHNTFISTESHAAPSTPQMVDEEQEQDDDDEVRLYSDDEDEDESTTTYAQGNQELFMPSRDPDSYVRAHPSITTLNSTVGSSVTTSPPLQRQSSSPLYTRGAESPSRGRPGYIHRTHTPTGTKFSLQDYSPSQRTLTRLGTSSSQGSLATASSHDMSTKPLTLADLQQSIARGIQYAEPESSGYTFPQHDSSDENMMSMSGTRKVGRQSKKNSPLSIMPHARDPPKVGTSTFASPTRKGHKHSNLNLVSEATQKIPTTTSFAGLANSRCGPRAETTSPPTKAELLKAARQKTVKQDPGLRPGLPQPGGSETRPVDQQQTIARPRTSESPTRPSFEPDPFTLAEYQAYAHLRLAYANALVLERAAGPLVSLYNGPDWPAQFPNPITSAVNSSLGFAREAALSFRHDVKSHPVYVKFQANGNDIATRARNDVYQTGGDLREIKERIDDWEDVDQEEGVQVTKLVVGSDS